MLRIGLTGGIASGKSHVLRRLAEAGFATVDLDEVGRAVMAPGGSAYAPVLREFAGCGTGAGGAIDRAALGRLVFGSWDARRRLNAIVHPLIREAEEGRAVAAERGGAALLVTDGALLVEVGSHLRFDRLIVTDCPAEAQRERLMNRDGMSRQQAQRRLAAQMPSDEKRRFATWVVETRGTLAETDAQVDDLIVQLRALVGTPRVPVALARTRVSRCLAESIGVGPRGLRRLDFVRAIAKAQAMDLSRLAALFQPPVTGPWYEAGSPAGGGDVGWLVIAGTLWWLSRGVADGVRLVAAAASLARLVERDPEAIASACLLAECAGFAAVHGAPPADWRSALTVWRREAGKWDAPAPAPEARIAVEVAGSHGPDVSRARGECRRRGGDVGTCGALVALGSGAQGASGDGADAAEICDLLGLT